MVELQRVAWNAVQVAAAAVLFLGCSQTDESEGVVPCGGNLVGSWANVNEHAPSPPNPNVNACWNLTGSYAGGVYSASTRYPSAERRSTFLQFRDDGLYTGAQQLTGQVTLKYAAECLVTDQGTPTCAELQAALDISGIGEGAYFDTLCADQVGGGCSCSVRVQEVGGMSGNWVLDLGANTVTLTRDPGLPEPNQLTVGYCSDSTGLRFGKGIDTWWRQTEGARFTPIDCTDGKQGPGEEGVDCGFMCPACAQP